MAEGKKFDAGKPQLDLIPSESLEEIGRVLAFGASKYGRANWAKGISASRLTAAALRHLFAWLRGENLDPESGITHLAHAGCNIVFLIWMLKHRPEMDDRWVNEIETA